MGSFFTTDPSKETPSNYGADKSSVKGMTNYRELIQRGQWCVTGWEGDGEKINGEREV